MMTHSPLHTLTYWSTAMSVDSSTQFRQSCHTSFANISRPPVINPSMSRCPHRRAPPLSQCQKSLLSSRIRQPRQYTQNTFGLPLPMATSFPTLPKNVLMQIRSWCASVRTIPAIQRHVTCSVFSTLLITSCIELVICKTMVHHNGFRSTCPQCVSMTLFFTCRR